ncbi:MAG: D-inositol 3-phosphate glycosyltransferase [Pseudomonadota bacterium]
MRCTVVSHGKFHAFALAGQLHRRGLLEHVVSSDPRVHWQAGVPLHKTRSVPIAEVPLRLGRRLGFDAGASDRLKRRLFSWSAPHLLGAPDLVVAWSGAARPVLERAKERGAVAVVERGCSHMAHQDAVLRVEWDKRGVRGGGIDPRDVATELAEYDAADFIAVPSTFARRTFLARGVPAAKLWQVPYGVDVSAFSPGPKTDGVFRVVKVGAVGLQKGVLYLLEAMRRLALPNAEVLLVGPVLPEIVPLLSPYEGLYRAVGAQPRAEVARLLRTASVYVSASLQEGLSLALREGQASGLAVVATDASGAEDVLVDGEDGFVVPSADVDALAQRVERLYRDAGLRRHFAERSLARARGWTWDDYGERISGLYRAAVESRVHC